MRTSVLTTPSVCVLVWALTPTGCFSSNNNGPPGSPDGAGPALDGSGAPDGTVASDDGGGSSDAASSDATSTDATSTDAAADAASMDASSTDGAPLDAAGSSSDAAVETDGAVPLGVASSNNVSLHGAASADGSAMLLLYEGLSSSTLIRWARYTPQTGWSTLANLPGGGNGAQGAEVGTDASGNALVAWEYDPGTGTGYTLAVVRYDAPSGTWSPVMSPDTSGQNLGGSVRLSVNAAGQALALTQQGTAIDGALGPQDVVAHYYDPSGGGSWHDELVMPGAGLGNPIAVKLSDTGLGAAVWWGGSYQTIATRTAGGTWTVGPNYSISQGATTGLAVNAAGDVLWGEQAGANTLHAIQYDASGTGTWSAAPTLLSAQVATSGCPVVVALTSTGDGALTHCYGPFGAPTSSIESFAFTKSTHTWGAASPLTLASGQPGATYAAAFDALANGYVVTSDFPDGGATGPLVAASSYSLQNGWSSQQSALGGPSRVFTAFSTPDGRGWAAWSDATSYAVSAQRVR